MRYETLERLANLRAPKLSTGEGIFATVSLLRRNSPVAAEDTSKECWAQIAVALILLGHGFCDEAHNLVGPLSFPTQLPYFHRSAATASPPSREIEAAASLTHCLVHRREGPHTSEFGMTGFANSDFWAGAALRFPDDLPLDEINGRLTLIAGAGADATQWIQTAQKNFVGCAWDPRPLTALCEKVLQQQPGHPMQPFAELAALTELKVLMKHALGKLGYETTHLSGEGEGSSTMIPSKSPVVHHDMAPQLPKTWDEALNLDRYEKFALVITTATRPNKIVHVNQAWVDLCGFSRQQAQGKTFAIIHGPETNTQEGAAMVRKCHETLQPQQKVLVNYSATGERFLNRLTIGPLQLQQGSGPLEYMVGILQNVDQIPNVAAA